MRQTGQNRLLLYVSWNARRLQHRLMLFQCDYAIYLQNDTDPSQLIICMTSNQCSHVYIGKRTCVNANVLFLFDICFQYVSKFSLSYSFSVCALAFVDFRNFFFLQFLSRLFFSVSKVILVCNWIKDAV